MKSLAQACIKDDLYLKGIFLIDEVPMNTFINMADGGNALTSAIRNLTIGSCFFRTSIKVDYNKPNNFHTKRKLNGVVNVSEKIVIFQQHEEKILIIIRLFLQGNYAHG
eukprot:snap_masked-scaffold_7-processed-gene-6.29-mRNA-1 protein AED:1.00 eAED:1.00 QI:0/0/0/0/1/1/2/0/108